MGKRIVIDLDKCTDCEKCTVECDYFYRDKVTDHGMLSLRELGSFAVYCRRCEDPSCVAACRFDAIERQPDGIMKRYNLRCVSCKCCSHACPFGTILLDQVPFYQVKCDFCLRKGGESDPPCVVTCVNKAVEYREVSEDEEGVYIVNDHLAVRSVKWDKKNV